MKKRKILIDGVSNKMNQNDFSNFINNQKRHIRNAIIINIVMAAVLIIVVAVTLILIAITATPVHAETDAGIASVVAADCKESVMLWQNAPAFGLETSYAFVGFEASPHGAPFVTRYIYTGTTHGGTAIYYADNWYGAELDRRTITVISGTIYKTYDNEPLEIGHVVADSTFTIKCKRAFIPIVINR